MELSHLQRDCEFCSCGHRKVVGHGAFMWSVIFAVGGGGVAVYVQRELGGPLEGWLLR